MSYGVNSINAENVLLNNSHLAFKVRSKLNVLAMPLTSSNGEVNGRAIAQKFETELSRLARMHRQIFCQVRSISTPSNYRLRSVVRSIHEILLRHPAGIKVVHRWPKLVKIGVSLRRSIGSGRTNLDWNKMLRILSKSVRMMFLLSVLLIAGCKEVLYSNLGERQSAEMMRVLQHNNISATRIRDKDELYTINIDSSVFGVAVTALNEAGLPKDRFKTMEDMFPADGIVGTPFEEKARYSFALSQELSATLTEIIGVQSARVHIVIPEQNRFEQKETESVASIAIYHTHNFDQNSFVPKIKSLVANAVPELTYDNVVIVLFPIQSMPPYMVPESSTLDGAHAYPQDGMVFAPGSSTEQMKVSLILLAMALGVLALVLSMFRKIWLFVRPTS